MYFYSQSILNGTLAQHRISFGPPKARGFQRKCSTTQNGLIREKRIRWKDQESGQSLEEAFEYLSLQEEEVLEWSPPHVTNPQFIYIFSVTGIYAILNAILHAHLNHYHWPMTNRDELLSLYTQRVRVTKLTITLFAIDLKCFVGKSLACNSCILMPAIYFVQYNWVPSKIRFRTTFGGTQMYCEMHRGRHYNATVQTNGWPTLHLTSIAESVLVNFVPR